MTEQSETLIKAGPIFQELKTAAHPSSLGAKCSHGDGHGLAIPGTVAVGRHPSDRGVRRASADRALCG